MAPGLRSASRIFGLRVMSARFPFLHELVLLRRKGWPIGSGVTESAARQFNKRVKGTEQFWSMPGVESILSLRAVWLSQDRGWKWYWNTRPAYSKAA
jgi:hypothetical protein